MLIFIEIRRTFRGDLAAEMTTARYVLRQLIV